MQRIIISILFLLLSLSLGASAVMASPLKRLVMPGAVIEGHAKYENECEKCHASFKKDSQRDLCLDCHKKVAADFNEKKGYHGLSPELATTECRRCHTDHEGRGAKIVHLDPQLFDHGKTDFPLKGNHPQVRCVGCHKPEKKYRDAGSKCIDCHKERDSHKGNLGEKCQDCHNESRWSENRFDHKKTKFQLEGDHEKVSCAGCHPNQRWKDIATDCYSCHQLNDAHGGLYGKKCEDCHSPKRAALPPSLAGREKELSRWVPAVYDHDKTKFPLKEKHRDVACAACHIKPLFKEKLGNDCIGCHAQDDLHRGRYGKKCQDCHNEKGWKKNRFDHDKTKLPLKDKHKDVACDRCHIRTVSEKKLGVTCDACHLPDDVHRGTFKNKCESCHNSKGWKPSTYDHQKESKFTLEGKHRAVKCESCHIRPVGEKKLGTQCLNCHKGDDVHKGQQGDRCDRCHSLQGWTVEVFFDHDLSPFPLMGQHAVLACAQCHVSAAYKDTKKDCIGCHRAQDDHEGRLGQRCESCHNPNDWALWSFDHSRTERFKPEGAHVGLECRGCHRDPVKGDDLRIPSNCIDCHLEQDVHNGRFGRNCERCHNSKSFKDVRILK